MFCGALSPVELLFCLKCKIVDWATGTSQRETIDVCGPVWYLKTCVFCCRTCRSVLSSGVPRKMQEDGTLLAESRTKQPTLVWKTIRRSPAILLILDIFK